MKALRKYLKKRENAINLILEKRQQCYTAETFHKLRVEIKKLDALFHLINYCSKEFKANKTFKPFKLIFRQAGKVRELQIEQSILKKHFSFNLVNDYRNHLKKLCIKEQNCFFTIINDPFVKGLKKKYRIITPLLTKLNSKKTTNYMLTKKAAIEKMLHQNTLKTKQVHSLRKELKEYQYNQKSLILERQDKPIPTKVVFPELLGKWHDYQVIIKNLKKAVDSGEINSTESSQLENIKATLIFKRQIVFNKINAALPILDFFDQEYPHNQIE
jgi:CHAD domain-containing protein